ncbi:MAG: hypothetical protein JXM79_10300 [Sedimentisphaerales bacterium]|nr:hypothetical protein [Sedimentisphaerales bacterium]
MKTMELPKAVRSVCLLLFVLLGASTTVTLAGENWPTWRGPDMNSIASGCNPPLKWGESENIKWKVKLTGDESNYPPAFAGDEMYLKGKHNLYCITTSN